MILFARSGCGSCRVGWVWISRRWWSTGYRAVREVLGGSPIGEVAARYGTTRQSVSTWRQRFQQEGMPGLANRSRWPAVEPDPATGRVGGADLRSAAAACPLG